MPGRFVAAKRLDYATLTNQNVFDWIDLRSYDIKVAGEAKRSA